MNNTAAEIETQEVEAIAIQTDIDLIREAARTYYDLKEAEELLEISLELFKQRNINKVFQEMIREFLDRS